MKRNQLLPIALGALFFLMLVGYRYSLLHDVSQLPYLQTPETVAPFTKLLTYFFMCIGILPTILIIIYTAFFCQTTYPAGVVLYTCFGNPFAFGDTTGFTAYLLASVLSIGAVAAIATAIFRAQKSHD